MCSWSLECVAHNPEAPMAETFSARSPTSRLTTRHLPWVTQDRSQYGRPVAYHSAIVQISPALLVIVYLMKRRMLLRRNEPCGKV